MRRKVYSKMWRGKWNFLTCFDIVQRNLKMQVCQNYNLLRVTRYSVISDKIALENTYFAVLKKAD